MIKSANALRYFYYFAIILVVAYLFVIPYNLHKYDRQWDFRTYYSAAKFNYDGGNPYNFDELKRSTSENIIVPYIYPPLAIYLWYPFLAFDYEVSYYLYYAIKLLILIYLIILWRKYFVSSQLYRALLLIFCVFAFKEAVQVDLYSGNISLFEQALLWTGLLFYIRKKPLYFGLFIAAASFIKFTSMFLLLLLFLDNDRKSWLSLIFSSLGLIAVHALSFIITPSLAKGFLQSVSALNETGGTNQASFVVLTKLADWFNGALGLNFAQLNIVFYIIFILTLFIVFYLCTRSYNFKADRFALVVGLLFLYALILPRLKDYSLILLIIPTLYIIERFMIKTLIKILTVIFICGYMVMHQSFFVILILFAFYLWGIRRESYEAALHNEGVCNAS